eukprot:gene21033-26980_t
MVVTTCLGNVFGTVALMNEGAEPHLMRRSPRDIKIHSLLDVGLLLHAFIYGNLIAFGASFNYFLVMADHSITFNAMSSSRWKWRELSRGNMEEREALVAWETAA